MIIEQLKPSERIQGRWLAVMDDGSILRVTEAEVVEFALYTGKELSDEEAEHLLSSARLSQLRKKSYDLLARKPVSRRELEKKIAQWGGDAEQCEALCDRMEYLGLLNDEEYAKRVAAHFVKKGYGKAKIRDEFYRRGVPKDLWDIAFAEVEDKGESEHAIDEFIRKKLKGVQPDRKQLQQVSAALARRGFSWSEIREGLARYGAEVWEE